MPHRGFVYLTPVEEPAARGSESEAGPPRGGKSWERG